MPDLKHALTQPPGRAALRLMMNGKGALPEQNRGARSDTPVLTALTAKAQPAPGVMGPDCMRIFFSR